jgi:hypothetical protein
MSSLFIVGRMALPPPLSKPTLTRRVRYES